MEFPFSDPQNTAVFTCAHILKNGAEICYVTHDEDDGAWQFLCNAGHTTADARIVGLKEIFDIDCSVGALAGMPPGCGAVRESKGAKWQGFKK